MAEAHALLAFSLDLFDWNWKRAEAEFQHFISLAPSYATAHQWCVWHFVILRLSRECLEELKKAERLDPLSLIIGADIADAPLIVPSLGRINTANTENR